MLLLLLLFRGATGFVVFCIGRRPSVSLAGEQTADERQEKFLRARGFVFDAERQTWTRPAPGRPRRRPAIVRAPGTNRVLEVRFEDSATEAAVAAGRRAARDLKETLDRATRVPPTPRAELEALGVGLVSPPVLVLAQLVLWELVRARLSPDALPPIGVGAGPLELLVTAGIFVAARVPGYGHWGALSGTLERAAADASRGAHAVPAPRSWRDSDKTWTVVATGLELAAAWPRCLALHAAMQAPLDRALQRLLVDATVDPTDAIGFSAATAIFAVALFAAAAELAAAGETTIDDMTIHSERHTLEQKLKDRPPVAGDVYSDLANAWLDKFALRDARAARRDAVLAPITAFARAAAAATAFRLAGDNLDAPFALHAAAAIMAVSTPFFLPTTPRFPPDHDDDPERALYVIR